MSCMIMQPEATAALATFLESVLNMGFNYFGFEAPYSLVNAARDCYRNRFCPDYYDANIYRKLYALNIAAYNGRYCKEESTADPAPDLDVYKFCFCERVEWESRKNEPGSFRYIIRPWHYKALKLLDFWLYQTAEAATENDPFRLAVQELDQILLGFIARNAPEYNSFPWGTI